MDPVNDIWRSLRRYGPYWWRYFSLIGPVDVPVKAGDLVRALGVQPRTASRLLNAARPQLADALTGGSTLLRGSRLLDDSGGCLGHGFSWANDRHRAAEKRRKDYLRRHGGPGDGFRTDKAADATILRLPEWVAWAEQVPGACAEAVELLRNLVGDRLAVADFLQGRPQTTAARADTVEHAGVCDHCVGGRSTMRCFH